jgi:hypothetical protein
MFKYEDFLRISGVGKKTANFLTFLSKNQTLDNTIKIDDCKDIQYIIKMNNLNTTDKIRYNFINNNIVKMKDGDIYEFIYKKY